MPSSFGVEKARRRRALRRAVAYPRLSFRQASTISPSCQSFHHREEYAPMGTESKLEAAGFETRQLDHRGTALRYLGGAPSNWLLVAPALAAERRVLVPALPGHGGSGALPGAETLDPYAEAVLAVLEHEDALPAPWVGHSLGGIIGLRAAVLRPDAVTGLVLAAAAGISSSTPTGVATVAMLGRVRPARFVRPYRRRVARSAVGRTLAFGGWGVADPVGFDPEMAGAFLDGAVQT